MPESSASTGATELPSPATKTPESKPSYVKLAMRNMVRKRGQSLIHFGLTLIATLGLLVGLAVTLG